MSETFDNMPENTTENTTEAEAPKIRKTSAEKVIDEMVRGTRATIQEAQFERSFWYAVYSGEIKLTRDEFTQVVLSSFIDSPIHDSFDNADEENISYEVDAILDDLNAKISADIKRLNFFKKVRDSFKERKNSVE